MRRRRIFRGRGYLPSFVGRVLGILEAPGAGGGGTGGFFEGFEVGFEVFFWGAVGEIGGHRVDAGEAVSDEDFGEVFEGAGLGFDEDEGMVAIGLHHLFPSGDDEEGVGLEEVEREGFGLIADGDGLIGCEIVEVLCLVAEAVRVAVGRFGSIDEIEAEGLFVPIGEAHFKAIAIVSAAADEAGVGESFETRVRDGGRIGGGTPGRDRGDDVFVDIPGDAEEDDEDDEGCFFGFGWVTGHDGY